MSAQRHPFRQSAALRRRLYPALGLSRAFDQQGSKRNTCPLDPSSQAGMGQPQDHGAL